MLDQAPHHQPLAIRRSIVGPLFMLCLFMLAGWVWLMVGAAVMRGAPAQDPRTASSL